MAYNWKPTTLNKCLSIAAGIDPKRYLSGGGKDMLKIIGLLAKDNPKPADICVQLAVIGSTYHFDMPNMDPGTEKTFLRAYVDLWLKANPQPISW